MGLVIGDALGVPVEFVSRDELKDNPVTDMIGYGTHNQPAGTWSDDSSMAVATMEWLGEIETQQPDYKQLMDKFSNWILYGDYTPYQENFPNIMFYLLNDDMILQSNYELRQRNRTSIVWRKGRV